VLLFAALFTLAYLRVEYVLEERTSNDKYAEFFREKNDFQVLFMGNSHVTNGIYPMELYNKYGFTSYNFGGHANTMPTTYWIARNALDYTSPKLMVVDMRLVGSQKKHSDQVRYLHISLDCFPMTMTKLSAIRDILEPGEREEFLWKMWIYHDRWDELDEKDFTGEKKLEKGAETRIKISGKARENRDYDKTVFLPEDTLGIRYLERLTTECKERGIALLFIYMPVSIDEEDAPEINSAPLIAEKLGVDYVDLNSLSLVDYDIDYFDNNGHLNPSGARKVTDYLGGYIKEHYDLEDVREDERFSSWRSDYAAYSDMKKENLAGQEDMYDFTMLLRDESCDVQVTVYDPLIMEDKTEKRLLENAGLLDRIRYASEEETDRAREYSGQEDRIYFKVTDAGTGEIVCERSF
jgi:hypothetical protein